MNKKLHFFFFLFLLFQSASSQILKKETLSILGNSNFVYANNKSFYIIESIGQSSVINTYNVQNYSLRQGFLQPVNTTLLEDSSNFDLDAVVFPNPFYQTVNISFNEPIFDELYVYVSDLMGRIVHSSVYNPTQTLTIQINDVASGTYLLNVRMRQKTLVTKIVRQ